MFIYCINYTIFTSKKIAYFSKNKKALITQNNVDPMSRTINKKVLKFE